MANEQSAERSLHALLDMMAGHRMTSVIYVATQLEIPDLLVRGAKSTADLAAQTKTHEPSLRRLLRALVTLGLCTQRDDEFELTPMGRHLAGDAQPSLRAWALFEGRMLVQSWGSLLDSIRTGKTMAELAGVNPDQMFEAMAKSGRAELFNQAMVSFTGTVAPDVVAAYDFSGISRLIDVGGGHGHLLAVILRAHPSMHGAIYDLPQCAEGGTQHLQEMGLSARSEFIAGSFFESIPSGSDALVLKSVIHDWDDEHSARILENCRRALAPAAKLLLVERIMPDTVGPNANDRYTVMSDLNMLRAVGGRERTESEFRALLEPCGFRITRVVPAGRMNVIESARV